jgi:glutamate racemase
MSDPRPIGVFDSGVGGLTVLRAIHDLLPMEPTIYVGDLSHFPYGPKDSIEVTRRAEAMAEYLLDQEVKALVVACNTATAVALPRIRELTDRPVIGVVEPGAAAALAVSSSRIIGVVATERTVASDSYVREIQRLDPLSRVHQIACGQLVGLVEAGSVDSDETRQLIQSAVSELVDGRHCDTIILGCTHFPLVRDIFEDIAGPSVRIVDSAETAASALAAMLHQSGLGAPTGEAQSHAVYITEVTANAAAFTAQARKLFGEHVEAVRIDVKSPVRIV